MSSCEYECYETLYNPMKIVNNLTGTQMWRRMYGSLGFLSVDLDFCILDNVTNHYVLGPLTTANKYCE